MTTFYIHGYIPYQGFESESDNLNLSPNHGTVVDLLRDTGHTKPYLIVCQQTLPAVA